MRPLRTLHDLGVCHANRHDYEHADSLCMRDPNHGALAALMQLEQSLGAYLAGGLEQSANAAKTSNVVLLFGQTSGANFVAGVFGGCGNSPGITCTCREVHKCHQAGLWS